MRSLYLELASSTDSDTLMLNQYSENALMSAELRETGHTPLLYEKVARLVESQIAAGTLRTNDRIPSVRAMSRAAGVSVATVVQAYWHLENAGLIAPRPQ